MIVYNDGKKQQQQKKVGRCELFTWYLFIYFIIVMALLRYVPIIIIIISNPMSFGTIGKLFK